MKLKKAIETLESHNKWRRGDDEYMQSPKEIGKAIDYAINALKKLEKNL